MALNILVADDTSDNVEILETLLKLEGHSVCGCTSGQSALEHVESDRPQVAILDVAMPDMTGIQVVEQARAQGADTVFIAISGYEGKADVDRARRAGFDYYLVKPPDLAALKTILEKIEAAGKC